MGGREGVLKQEGLLCTLGNALTDGPKGSFGVGKPDKAGTRRAGNRESYTSRPVNSSRTVAANRPWAQIQETKSGSGIQTHPAHTHLAAQRAGPGSRVHRGKQTGRVQRAGLAC